MEANSTVETQVPVARSDCNLDLAVLCAAPVATIVSSSASPTNRSMGESSTNPCNGSDCRTNDVDASHTGNTSPALRSETSEEDGAAASSTDDDVECPKVDVLYSLEVDTDGSWKTFFQDTPFNGIDYKLSDTSRSTVKDNPTIIHVYAYIETADLSEKEGNTVWDWWKRHKRLDTDRKIKVDRVILRRISIKSQELLKVLDSIIDYNPIQSSAELSSHILDSSGSYSTLLMYYDDIYDMYKDHVLAVGGHERSQQALCGIVEHGEDRANRFWDEFGRSRHRAVSWDEDTWAEVAVLLRLIGPHYRNTITPIVRKLQLPQPRVEFEKLWLLFKPGTIVYKCKNDELIALVTVFAGKVRRDENAGGLTLYEVVAWYYEWDGNSLVRVSTLSRIEQYEGDRSVLTLPIVPARFYDKHDSGAGRVHLKQRGERFLELIKTGFSHNIYEHPRSSYKGQIIIDPAEYNELLEDYIEEKSKDRGNSRGLKDRYSRIFEGRPEEYFDRTTLHVVDYEPKDGRGYRRLVDFHEIDTSKPEQLAMLLPEAIVLLSPRVRGFALGIKRWMRFEVEGISSKHAGSLQNQLEKCLVINDDDREILRTVLDKTVRRQRAQADFIPGKGEGQVFLLHGPAGTGKTLTAECVANDTHRPLICLTSDDFDEYGYGGVHEHLVRRWFSRAAKWGAVLLIDEADIFLAKRSSGDSRQNAPVTGNFNLRFCDR